MFEVDRRYEAGREDYDVVVQELKAAWDESDRVVMDQRFAVKSIVNEAEWSEMMQIMNKKVKKLQKKVDKAWKKKQDDLKDGHEDLEKAEKKAAEK